MRVNVKGFGIINFPDSMSETDIKKALKKFDPKKDDRFDKLLEAVYQLASKQVVQDTVTKAIEVEKVIEKPVIQTVNIPVKEKTAWRFTISREDDEIVEIYAEPVK